LARIDRLPGRARAALQEAAVIGVVFSAPLLRRITSAPATLDTVLEALIDVGLLARVAKASTVDGSETDAAQYRFRHGLFQEVSYQNLLARRRADLHTRIGETLEALGEGKPPRAEDLQILGHHFRLSNDKAKGARYLTQAGDWARSIYANADAIRNYELALETLDATERAEAERIEVRERLSDVLTPIGERDSAWVHLEAAREVYKASGNSIAHSRVLRKIAELHWAVGQRLDARRCVQEALALLVDTGDHLERAHLFQQLGHLDYRSGDNVSALEWIRQALAQMERIAASPQSRAGDEHATAASAMSTILNTQGVALARLERFVEAIAALERSVAIARDAGLLHAESRGLAILGVLYGSRNPQQAIDACERSLEVAKRIGDLGLQSRMYANLAIAYCELTNRCEERGVAAAQMAIDIDRRAGFVDHLAVSLVVLGQIYQCHGDPEQALVYYVEASALAEKSGEPQLLFPCYDGLATLYLDLDDPPQAEIYMDKARQVCEHAGLDPDAMMVLSFLV
ncbi:MAG: tetratricopeptide repeat protein, partial [Betaproteobacteria bacterium]